MRLLRYLGAIGLSMVLALPVVAQTPSPSKSPAAAPSAAAKATQPAGQDAAKPVQLGSLGSVQASSGVDGSVLAANPTAPANWFVQVTGTENLATLQQLIKPIHV